MHTSFSDSMKASDRVDHCLLVSEMTSLGIRDKVVVWGASYLSGRKFVVRVESVFSSRTPSPSGVQQGLVSGAIS